MTVFQSIILGIIEGLTEFLPVSSTFHLILASRWLGLPPSDFQQLFEVVIQSGAILALLFLYTQTLLTNPPLLRRVLVSFLPTAVIGAILYRLIKGYFFGNIPLQIGVFFVVGLLFLYLEHQVSRGRLSLDRDRSSLSYPEAALIGLAQAFSVVPGVSRSGSIIVAMMLLKFRRDTAAEYTFLLSLPTIFAASALDLYQNRALLSVTGPHVPLLLLGTTASFVTALLVVNWFLRYLRTHTLRAFGWYRLLLAPLLYWLL